MKVIFLDKIPLNSDYEYTINTTQWNNVIASLAIPPTVEYPNVDFDWFITLYPYDNWIECNLENIDNVNYFVSVDLHKNPYHNTTISYNYMLAYDGTKVHHFFVDNVKHISSKKYSETNITSRYDISLKKNLFAEYNINEGFNGNSHIHTKRKHCVSNDEHKYIVEDSLTPSFVLDKKQYRFIKYVNYLHEFSMINIDSPDPYVFKGSMYMYVISTKKYGGATYFSQGDITYPYYVYCIPFENDVSALKHNDDSGKDEDFALTPLFGLDDLDIRKQLKEFFTDTETQKIIVSDMPPISICEGYPKTNGSGSLKEGYYALNNDIIEISVHVGNADVPFFMGCCAGVNYKERPYFVIDIESVDEYKDEDEPKLNCYPYKSLCVVNGNQTNYYSNLDFGSELNLYYDFSIENIIRTVAYVDNTYTVNGDESKSQCCEYVQNNVLPLITDFWKDYVAQNKNFFHQGVGLPLIRGMANTLTGVGMGGQFNDWAKMSYLESGGGYGMGMAAMGQYGNAFLSAVNTGVGIANTMMSWENIKNTPDMVKSLGINVLKEMRFNKCGVYALICKCPTVLYNISKTKFKHFGYEYDDECDYRDFFVKEHYNYIVTLEDVIDKKAISMTNYERKIINDIFKRGITMFNESCIMYDEQSNPYIDYTSTNPDRS